MRRGLLLPLVLLLALLPAMAAVAATSPIRIDQEHANAIGHYASYLQEAAGPLTLEQASAAYADGKFSDGKARILNFGIGAKPVWVHFSVDNPTLQRLPRQLSIETAWLDRVDVYFSSLGNDAAAYHVGDRKAFTARPFDNRFFVFEHTFGPGASDVFIRVETPDPMVIPMYLLSPQQAQSRLQMQDYSYGFLYGFLAALLIYNVMLYIGLRDASYLLYSLYLAAFLLMNIAYTGHGFRWLWPNLTSWAQWANPVLMVLYGTAGLFFALSFLDIRAHFPRLQRAVLGYIAASALLLLLAILADSQRAALLVSFVFVSLFTAIMLALGVISVRSGRKPARYFLLAAISAMVGAALTSLSVWGLIPTTVWTYRAVDIGMLLDATLLALALTYRFRVGQADKLRAEQLATIDPLTGINNRRAFYEQATPLWNVALRHNKRLSIILLDIDRFKQINDSHGHARGDELLVATARALTDTVRKQDIVARWGGEEFIVLLPETGLAAAAVLAERLRATIENIRVGETVAAIAVTASFGVAQRELAHQTLDAVISAADNCLYRSKEAGRNRVTSA